jgi:hypothetical protein
MEELLIKLIRKATFYAVAHGGVPDCGRGTTRRRRETRQTCMKTKALAGIAAGKGSCVPRVAARDYSL